MYQITIYDDTEYLQRDYEHETDLIAFVRDTLKKERVEENDIYASLESIRRRFQTESDIVHSLLVRRGEKSCDFVTIEIVKGGESFVL